MDVKLLSDSNQYLNQTQKETYLGDPLQLTSENQAIFKISQPTEFKIKISVNPNYLAILKEAKKEEFDDEEMEIEEEQSRISELSHPFVLSSLKPIDSNESSSKTINPHHSKSPKKKEPNSSQSQQDKDMWDLDKLEKLREQNKLTFKQAGAYVLWKSNRLLNATEIVEEALHLKLIKTAGKTPNATMSSRINTDISEKANNSIFCKFGVGKFSIKPKIVQHIKEEVIEPEERMLGMTLLAGSALRYIPCNNESNWLEVRPSQIPQSGLGLFTMKKITTGTVFCEYKGRLRPIDGNSAGNMELFPYAVGVQMADGSKMMIDGLHEDEKTVLSLAPRANDAGPVFKNCIYVEYKEHPGHVFLEAVRDIQPNDEIFVCYGINYWNIPAYPIFDSLTMYAKLPSLAKEIGAKKENSNSMTNSTIQMCDDDLEFSQLHPLNYDCRPSSVGSLKLIFRKVS